MAFFKNKDFLAIVFFVLLTVIFFWKFFLKGLVPIPADIIVGVYYPWLDYKWGGFEAGVPVKNPLPSDIVSVHFPFKMFAIDQLKNGQLPLWNPYSFAGSPLLANFQTAIFYPLTILYFFLPIVLAWSTSFVFQPFLATTFTYFLLRHFGLERFAAAFGGFAFGFSPFLVTWSEYNILAHTAIFMPLFILAVDKLILKPKFRWVILGSVAFAMHFFAGYPQFLFYTGIATLGILIFRWFDHSLKFRDLFLKIFLILTSVILGIGLSAIQLLPGVEFLLHSIRINDLKTLAGTNFGFLPWRNMITFFAPDYFGHPATGNYWGIGFYDNFVGYTGIIVLTLATYAVSKRPKKIVYLFSILAFISLLLALKTPLSVGLQNLNILGFASAVPSRSLVLLSFSAAVLAALGIEKLLIDLKNKKAQFPFLPILIPLSVICGVAIGNAIAIAIHKSQFPLLNQSKIEGELISDLVVKADYIRTSLRNIIFPGAISICLIVLVIIFRNFKFFNSKMLFLLLFILSFVDLFRFGSKYLSFSKAEFLFPETPALEFLEKQEQPFRIAGDVLPQNFWVPYNLSSAAGYDALYPLSYSQFLGGSDTGNIKNTKARFVEIDNYDSKLVDLINIKYLMVLKRKEQKPSQKGDIPQRFKKDSFKKVFDDKTVAILENKQVLSRAFFVDKYEIEADPQKTMDRLLSQDFDIRKKIILAKKPVLDLKLDSSSLNGNVKFTEYFPNFYSFKVNSQKDGLIFVSDQFYPGWKAFVDGEQTEIIRANLAFRAVPILKGDHIIKFVYQPESFKIGALISLLTVVSLSGLFIIMLIRKNQFL